MADSDLSWPRRIQRKLEDLKAALREIPAEKLGGQMLLPWARRGPVSAVVDVLVDHEYEHLPDLLKAREAQPPVADRL